jgi:fructose-1-phosphate kinase PfkB-like protein
MPSIVTITFNPCVDISSSVDTLVPEKKNAMRTISL